MDERACMRQACTPQQTQENSSALSFLASSLPPSRSIPSAPSTTDTNMQRIATRQTCHATVCRHSHGPSTSYRRTCTPSALPLGPLLGIRRIRVLLLLRSNPPARAPECAVLRADCAAGLGLFPGIQGIRRIWRMPSRDAHALPGARLCLRALGGLVLRRSTSTVGTRATAKMPRSGLRTLPLRVPLLDARDLGYAPADFAGGGRRRRAHRVVILHRWPGQPPGAYASVRQHRRRGVRHGGRLSHGPQLAW